MTPPDEHLVEQKRWLCRALRAHRENAGLTQDQAADALEWSYSKFLRIELGATGITRTDLQAALRLYGVTDEREIGRLEAAQRTLRGKPALDLTKITLPFEELVKRVESVTGVNGCPFTPEELSERWHEPKQRISDAQVTVRWLREKGIADAVRGCRLDGDTAG